MVFGPTLLGATGSLRASYKPTGKLRFNAQIARDRNLWVVSDEAYEDVVFNGEHISIASLPGMYDRTIPVYTMSKSYAITGVRVGYFAIKDETLRDRALKIVLYTTSNVSSIAQYGAVGAMAGSQQCIADFKTELLYRRDMFYKGLEESAPGVFSGKPPDGAFYAFVKINPEWAKDAGIKGDSLSWAMAEYLIKHGRIGCVPGVDFGASCEGYIRFCTCRSREELTGALADRFMQEIQDRRIGTAADRPPRRRGHGCKRGHTGHSGHVWLPGFRCFATWTHGASLADDLNCRLAERQPQPPQRPVDRAQLEAFSTA